MPSVLDILAHANPLAFDAETTGTSIPSARVLGMSASDTHGIAGYFNTDNIPLLKGRLTDPNVLKLAHNASFDRSMLKKVGITVDTFADTMVAAHMLNELQLGRKMLALKYLGVDTKDFDELVGKGKYRKSISEFSIAELASYSIPHSTTCAALWGVFEPKLNKWGLARGGTHGPFWQVEMPLVPVLSDMEIAGVMIDEDELNILGKEFSSKIELLEDALTHTAGGVEINWNSPDQVAWLLFKKLGLPGSKPTKQGKRYSTDASVLDSLRGKHPVISLMLKYREYRKLRDTYVNGLREVLVNGRAHTSFNQCGTRTGRLSSSGPALQNIPTRKPEGKRIRGAFVAPEGCSLVEADFDQMELRDAAHESQDKVMINQFLRDEDIHLAVAIMVFNDLLKRREGKGLNFATIYGAGDAKVAELTGLSLSEAKKYRKKYFEVYQDYWSWIQRKRAEALETACATTLMGRKRVIYELLPYAQGSVDILSGYSMVREHGIREFINTIIQGSCAEICKVRMRDVWEKTRDSDVKIILQVHDEIILEVPDPEVDEVVHMLERVVPYYELSVPMPCTIRVGKRWNMMEEVDGSKERQKEYQRVHARKYSYSNT